MLHSEVRIMPMELIVRFVLTIIIFIIIIVILSKFRAEKSQPETDDSLEIMKKRLLTSSSFVEFSQHGFE